MAKKSRRTIATEAVTAAASEANPVPRARRKRKAGSIADPSSALEASAAAAVEASSAAETNSAAAAAPDAKRKRAASKATAAEPEAKPAPKKRRKRGEAVAAADAPVATPVAASLGTTKEMLGTPSPSADSVERTVFIDGVPYDWDEAKIREHFTQCGAVTEVRAPVWQDSGRLRGFAHVTFAQKAARKAALALDGSKVGKKGRYLKIEAAKPPVTVEGVAAEDAENKRRLFVKNLPYDATEKEVGDLFLECGKVREVRIPTTGGHAKGFAYVEFARSDGLLAAVRLQPPPALRGRALRLDVDAGRGPKAGFHRRKEAYGSGYGPEQVSGGKGRGGKGKAGGKGRGGRAGKLQLF